MKPSLTQKGNSVSPPPITYSQRVISACSGSLITSLSITPLDVIKVRMQSAPPSTHVIPRRSWLPPNSKYICVSSSCSFSPVSAASSSTMSCSATAGGFRSCRVGMYAASLSRAKTYFANRAFCSHCATNLAPHYELANCCDAAAVPLPRNCYASSSAVSARHHCAMMLEAAAATTSKSFIRDGANAANSQKMTAALPGFINLFKHIVKHEGIHSLWSGLSPTLIMSVPQTVIYFTLNDYLKHNVCGYSPAGPQSASPPHSATSLSPSSSSSSSFYDTYVFPLIPGACGGFSRFITQLLINPLELIRTRMQSNAGGLMTYANISHTVRSSVQLNGISVLWLGIQSSLWRDVPYSVIGWALYEALKSEYIVMQQQQHQRQSEIDQHNLLPPTPLIALFSALAGIIAGFMTHPFDVIKTHQQVELGRTNIVIASPKSASSHSPTTRTTTKAKSVRSRTMWSTGRAIYEAGAQREVAGRGGEDRAAAERALRVRGGVRALYRGLAPRLVRVGLATGMMISIFEVAKDGFVRRNRARQLQHQID